MTLTDTLYNAFGEMYCGNPAGLRKARSGQLKLRLHDRAQRGFRLLGFTAGSATRRDLPAAKMEEVPTGTSASNVVP
jgi:hypothetical protein